MKKLIIPAFALALAAGAPAIAWSHDDQNDKHHTAAGQGDGAKPEHGDKTPGNDKTPGDHTPGNDKTPGDHTPGNDKTPGDHTPGNDKTPGDHTPGNDKTPGDHTPNGPHRSATSGGDNNKADERERTRDLNRNGSNSQWNKDLHGDNNNHNDNDHRAGGVHVNINLGSYRRAVTSSHHFRAGAYRAPSHYSYRRYSIGERLQPEFYGRDYWLSDFSAYDLMSPPDGYVWVRFGPDALLIDEDTGEVLQVVYGVFI